MNGTDNKKYNYNTNNMVTDNDLPESYVATVSTRPSLIREVGQRILSMMFGVKDFKLIGCRQYYDFVHGFFEWHKHFFYYDSGFCRVYCLGTDWVEAVVRKWGNGK